VAKEWESEECGWRILVQWFARSVVGACSHNHQARRIPYSFQFQATPKAREPLTYLEQKRREAQLHYLEEQKYIADNKATFDKLIEEDRKAQEAQMSGSMWTVLQMMVGGQPPQPPQPGQPSEQQQRLMAATAAPVQEQAGAGEAAKTS
jgi:hypothetical protein